MINTAKFYGSSLWYTDKAGREQAYLKLKEHYEANPYPRTIDKRNGAHLNLCAKMRYATERQYNG